MPFVASYSVPIAATTVVPVGKNLDLSGNGFSLARYTHVRITGNTAAGSLTATNDANSNSVLVNGLASEVMPVPPSANNITVTIGDGGTGVLAFGRDRS